MIPPQLIHHECRRRGLSLWSEGGTLRVEGPAGAIDAGMSETLARHAAAMVAYLAQIGDSGPKCSPHEPETSPQLVRSDGACGLHEKGSIQAINLNPSPHSPHETQDKDSRNGDFYPQSHLPQDARHAPGVEIIKPVYGGDVGEECGLCGLDQTQIVATKGDNPSPHGGLGRGLVGRECGLGAASEGDPHEFEERAGIIEFEAGGMPRALAERVASAVARGAGVFRDRPENLTSDGIAIPQNWRKWAEWLPADLWREWRRLAANLSPSRGATIEQIQAGDRDALMVILDEHPELELWRAVDARV